MDALDIPEGDIFKERWKKLPLNERLRIRLAVGNGRAVRDPQLALLATGLARKWLAHPFVRNPVLGTTLSVGVSVAAAAVVRGVWGPSDARLVLPARPIGGKDVSVKMSHYGKAE